MFETFIASLSCYLTAGVALLFPRIAVGVIAVAFPEAEAVVVEQHETSDPLDAFPCVELRDDEAQRAAVLASKRLAVMLEGEENIWLQQIFERHVGRVTLLGKNGSKMRAGLWLDQLHHIREQHTFPVIVEAAPARNAMEVGHGFGLR